MVIQYRRERLRILCFATEEYTVPFKCKTGNRISRDTIDYVKMLAFQLILLYIFYLECSRRSANVLPRILHFEAEWAFLHLGRPWAHWQSKKTGFVFFVFFSRTLGRRPFENGFRSTSGECVKTCHAS